MVEKDLVERNSGFDSQQYMSRDMEEKGIVARDCLPPEPRCPLPDAEATVPRQRAAGLRRETITVNNHGQKSLSPPCRSSVHVRLMWKWKNQRRLKTRRSRLRFIISSGGAHSFWP